MRSHLVVIERHNDESFEQWDYYNKAVEREALLSLFGLNIVASISYGQLSDAAL
jgi:hypothetical protein